MGKRLWITYAWEDNQTQDVDFIIGRLEQTGLSVSFDRRTLVPGQRLWQQIGGTITDPSLCEAWAIVLTAKSLLSRACMEELELAVSRAISANGDHFPLIALLHGFPPSELPPLLRTRLAVSLSDPAWVQHVVAAVECRSPGRSTSALRIEPYICTWHPAANGAASGLEVRPRLETIAPFAIAVDLAEHTSGNVTWLRTGSPGRVPTNFFLQGYWKDEDHLIEEDGRTAVWIQGTGEAASPTRSYYLICDHPPRRLWVGAGQALLRLDSSPPRGAALLA